MYIVVIVESQVRVAKKRFEILVRPWHHEGLSKKQYMAQILLLA